MFHRHDWGVWRWQVDYTTDEPSGLIYGKWIRYCKHCPAEQLDEVRTAQHWEEWQQEYIKAHPYMNPNNKIEDSGGQDS